MILLFAAADTYAFHFADAACCRCHYYAIIDADAIFADSYAMLSLSIFDAAAAFRCFRY